MAYYNPNYSNPLANLMAPQRPQINPEQFRAFAMTLNDQSLNNFAQLARRQGISEKDIQDGIRFIHSLS